MAVLKQSTAYTRAFLMIASSDHLSGLTGATPSVSLSKAGGVFAGAAGSITEIANGWYKVALTSVDTGTLGDLAYHITATSGDNTDFVDQIAVNILGDTLPANVTQISGSNVSTSSAQIGVNLVNIAGSPVSTSSAQLGVNVVQYNAQTAQTDANNLPKVDVEDIGGAALSTHASGMMPADLRDIAGSAVSTSSAQLGVNVVTNGDKTGYSLSQSFPANFSSLSIDGSGNVATTSNIKKNTAKNGFMFVMTDSTTHAPKTGLTVTTTRSIDGGVFASATNSATEVATGTYVINLSAADTNGDHIMLRFTATGADDLNIEIVTQP